MNKETIKAAREALDSLDDYARMNTGMDAHGPRGVLEKFISAAEHSPSAQDRVLTDERISAIYEQSQGMILRDRDFQGVKAFAKALLEAVPVATNPDNAIREAILQYYDDLSARKHGGVAQDKALQAIQDALGMSWTSGVNHRAKYAAPSPAVAPDHQPVATKWAIYYDNLSEQPYTSGWMTEWHLYNSEEEARSQIEHYTFGKHYIPRKVEVFLAATPSPSLAVRDGVDWKTRAEQDESRLSEIQRGVEGLTRWDYRWDSDVCASEFGCYKDGGLIERKDVLALLAPQCQASDTSGMPG